MQEEQQEEKQDPLFYDLPLPRLLAWTRWWHLTAQDRSPCVQEENLGSDWAIPKEQEGSIYCSHCSAKNKLVSQRPRA